MTDPTTLTLAGLAAAYRTGVLDPTTATEAYLARIAEKNPALNAYIAVYEDEARAAAAAATQRWRTGAALGLLDGAPVALKDNIDIAGKATANGCAFGAVAATDAPVTAKLRAAGAVILGKLNQHELALGATTDNPHWGRTENPLLPGHTPGGSSGGSGAAVAAGLAAATLGTDTMGSVRIPAAYCGVYGLKPTFGAVSNAGVSPLAWSLDHVGPLARSPEDLALMLSVIAEAPSAAAGPESVAGLKVGRVAEVDAAEMDDAVRAAFEAFLAGLADQGAEIVDIAWPGFDFSRNRRAGLLVCEADSAAAYREDLENRPERFSDIVRGMLDYGANATAARLAEARRRLDLAGATVLESFRSADVIALPTAPMPPFPFDGPHPSNQADFCAPANFAGCPALSMPVETASEPPIGMQLLAPRRGELSLCRVAAAISSPATRAD